MASRKQLQAQADALKARIEADVRAKGIDPTTTDAHHPRNKQWQHLNDALNDEWVTWDD